jgi:PAS domain S-box-containing protein
MKKGPRDVKGFDLDALLEHLNVGVALTTWPSGSPQDAKWVYLNETRCRMSGYAREELMASSPLDLAARETTTHLEIMLKELAETGEHTFETMLLCRDKSVLPIECYMKRLTFNETRYVLVEYRDMTREGEIRANLRRMEENAREMLKLLEKEKEHLRTSVAENLMQVVMPLLDQLRETPPEHVGDLVALLKNRVQHVAHDFGIKNAIQTLGVALTSRQRLICEMIRDGMTTKAIAGVLGCSARTISNHRNTIRKKLGLSGQQTSLDCFLSNA